MNKVRTAVFLTTGALAALGLAGTALAADGGFSPSASPSVTASSSYEESTATVSAEAAREIAIQAAGGGRVESVERETEHGRPVWDVDVIVDGVEHDIDVDRVTGEVLRHRIEGGADVRVSPSATSRVDDHGGRGRGGDDNGVHSEAGDDKGGLREAGDDHGGLREAGDDHGGAREAGDDRGGRHGGGDDRGRGGHGSDD
ncbi:PepSY domain-containing protein [Actinoplanes regularis]|uniref:PepSY domain-containing protein n=1 Tax=Actinoplanes regularis TaxID=52697 RepID=UPI0024A15FE5|nr:PepSY domain-containing protein [Actinoplanes regularis]GLW34597.1 hypothetical protein Areg01_75340 [Actinoplanes regularis]